VVGQGHRADGRQEESESEHGEGLPHWVFSPFLFLFLLGFSLLAVFHTRCPVALRPVSRD
ncbi:MAG TPA: hypothetical protein VF266_13325, partial [Thermoanaerobaculia bacterium]